MPWVPSPCTRCKEPSHKCTCDHATIDAFPSADAQPPKQVKTRFGTRRLARETSRAIAELLGPKRPS